jgi:hypothetical protein
MDVERTLEAHDLRRWARTTNGDGTFAYLRCYCGVKVEQDSNEAMFKHVAEAVREALREPGAQVTPILGSPIGISNTVPSTEGFGQPIPPTFGWFHPGAPGDAFTGDPGAEAAPPIERIWCMKCGKSVSTPVPKGTIMRAWVECPECIEKGAAAGRGCSAR